jgi:hypothetical protein
MFNPLLSRLEQWARIVVGGLAQMYIWLGNELEPIENKPKWYHDSIHVFQGDFTCPDDKYVLVDTVCGVWAHALRARAEDSAVLIDLVRKNKASIFPKEYFGDLIEILEEQFETLEFDQMVVSEDALPKELINLPSQVFKTSENTPKVKRNMSLRAITCSREPAWTGTMYSRNPLEA